MEVNSLNSFKSKLDQLWENEDSEIMKILQKNVTHRLKVSVAV